MHAIYMFIRLLIAFTIYSPDSIMSPILTRQRNIMKLFEINGFFCNKIHHFHLNIEYEVVI